MAHQHPDHHVRTALRSELEGWRARRGPDLCDLLHRAERAWTRPVFRASLAGTAGVALLLAVCVGAIALGPALPQGDVIRQHLLAP